MVKHVIGEIGQGHSVFVCAGTYFKERDLTRRINGCTRFLESVHSFCLFVVLFRVNCIGPGVGTGVEVVFVMIREIELRR